MLNLPTPQEADASGADLALAASEDPDLTTVPQAIDLTAIATCLTHERLRKYLARTDNDVGKALALYEWNHEVGAVLTTTMQQLEVCLRNKISDALSARSFEIKHGPNWHTSVKLKHSTTDLRSEWERVADKARENRNGFDPALPDFVAAATLGFWRELCKPAYAGVFWGKRVATYFPNISITGDTRTLLTEIHRRVDLILKLRNRIAHHEPIIGAAQEPVVGKKLRERHRDMIEVLGWMDTNFAQWVLRGDRFESVMDACPVPKAPPLGG